MSDSHAVPCLPDDPRRLAPLPRAFYDRDPAEVACALLGKLLLREADEGLCGGRIVEVEAYLSRNDPACHASRGMTQRNAAMFGPPGRAYVYMIHSRWCLNAVTEPEGVPSAVLIRAIEPWWGLEAMQRRRGTDVLRDLARGPARLCEALAIDRQFNHWDLTCGQGLWIAEGPTTDLPWKIGRSGRIGIRMAQRRLLRFFWEGNPFVSGRFRLGRGASHSRTQSPAILQRGARPAQP
jgi:DNA-3-methyladenine glycosylase